MANVNCRHGVWKRNQLLLLWKEIKPPRPLTHDLFKTLQSALILEKKQVIIHKLVDGFSTEYHLRKR
jgi:bifunctional DNase/RNase